MRILKSFYWKFYVKLFPNIVVLLRREFEGCKSFLDLGCGKESPVKYFSNEFSSVGVDVYEPYITESRSKGIHNKYFLMDVRKLKFKPKSFDIVLALDLIEHLTKKEGERLLREMERIAKKKVIVFTPNGLFCDEMRDENVHQIHKCGWTVSEMRERGYRVVGINGIKLLRGRGKLAHLQGKDGISHYAHYLWWIISDITQVFAYHFPEHAFQMLCVKDVGKK
ncbi:MAG: class I SAM-dependent methyltransferase [Candidatus Micrarchaeota archaeon]|nr:class I SAM-dependent methyltransferase [Candidatus Micrarchaeota archaeon]